MVDPVPQEAPLPAKEGAPSRPLTSRPRGVQDSQGAMGQASNKLRQSLYFPEEMLREIQAQATRQDRSLSWIVQQAWRIARAQMARIPGVNDQPASQG